MSTHTWTWQPRLCEIFEIGKSESLVLNALISRVLRSMMLLTQRSSCREKVVVTTRAEWLLALCLHLYIEAQAWLCASRF